MNIVYCINNSGHNILLAALKSIDLCSNNHKKYVLFDTKSSYENFLMLAYTDFTPILFENIEDDIKFLYSSISKVEYMPESTYLRLILPFLFENEQFLYLDHDTLVMQNIDSDLLNLEKGFLYAVKDEGIGLNYSHTVGLPLRHVYFNAGVLFFNCISTSKYRILLENLITLINENHFIKGVLDDQDILNNVFDNYKQLSSAFNYQTNNFVRDSYFSYYSNRNIYKILHFVGPAKPWLYPTYPIFHQFYKSYYFMQKRKFSIKALKFIFRFNGIFKYFQF